MPRSSLHRSRAKTPKTSHVRSDNGLIFQSRQFRKACRFHGLSQEFIMPYTPQQNGLIERFFRSLKEECVWQNIFIDFSEARRVVTRWIRWHNEERPHPSLNFLSPVEYRTLQRKRVA